MHPYVIYLYENQQFRMLMSIFTLLNEMRQQFQRLLSFFITKSFCLLRLDRKISEILHVVMIFHCHSYQTSLGLSVTVIYNI